MSSPYNKLASAASYAETYMRSQGYVNVDYGVVLSNDNKIIACTEVIFANNGVQNGATVEPYEVRGVLNDFSNFFPSFGQ